MFTNPRVSTPALALVYHILIVEKIAIAPRGGRRGSNPLMRLINLQILITIDLAPHWKLLGC